MTKRKDPKDLLKVGVPSTFRPEYCQLLIEHSKKGGSFEAFGAKVGCSIQTLYNWMQANPEFLEARKKAQAHLHVFFEALGMAIASGGLKRVVSEEPMLTEDFRPIRDPETGELLMKRTYEPVTGNSTAWIFMAKNMLGWRNDVEINLNLPEAPKAKGESSDGLTPKERFDEIREAMKVIQELQEEDEAIDVTPPAAKQA